jgi:selenocysteine lyase/cysteine desulfurase
MILDPSVLNTLRHLCYCTQEFVELKVVDVALPIPSYEAFVDQVAAAITPNTRLAVLDHIASVGFVVPLEKLIPIFHERGIPVLVDGASAPGQLPLNLVELGVDFYVGSCYKWLFGSKSCSFLYVAKEHQVRSCWVVSILPLKCVESLMSSSIEHGATRGYVAQLWPKFH